MTSLCFITPAYQRFELTAIAFKARAWLHDELREMGIETQTVVVADDANLPMAQHFGFEIVRKPNDYLGRKFNAGYHWAWRSGFDFVCPLDSDSWVHPSYFTEIGRSHILTAHYYSIFNPTGKVRADLWTTSNSQPGAVGPYVIPTSMLNECEGNPVDGQEQRVIHRTTMNRLRQSQKLNFEYHDWHPLQYLGFHSRSIQVTPFNRYVKRYLVKKVTKNPFEGLLEIYPERLVNMMKLYYEGMKWGVGNGA